MAKILVFDDSKLMREFTSAPLREAGHEVLGVEPDSLFDALKHINEFGPDIVVAGGEHRDRPAPAGGQ